VTSELLLVLVRLNLSLCAAILLVLLLRGPVRRISGADVAYTLWVLPPLVVVGDLIASILSFLQLGGVGGLLGGWDAPPLPPWLGQVWAAGALAGLALMVVIHINAVLRFRKGTLGPAVMGLLQPRLCLPADFDDKFTPNEQRLIRAHERVHMVRNDVIANTLVGLLRCLLWFNPLVHMAAVAIKHDQEMACDAEVMDVYPDQRRRYAAAMLKAGAGPLGVCAFGSHPLEARIHAIVRGAPLPHPRIVGIVGLGFGAFMLLGVYATSFASEPPRLVGPYSAGYYAAFEAERAKELGIPAWLNFEP
jgi:beta-lactamase regulating signal transducer with metallopeptidase domain